jgi:DNA-binding transcriptional LysR family regulator
MKILIILECMTYYKKQFHAVWIIDNLKALDIAGIDYDLLNIVIYDIDIHQNKSLEKIYDKKLEKNIYRITFSFSESIKEKIDNEVHLKLALSADIIEQLEDKKIDVALIESPIFVDGMVYREWVEDELVVFSNQPLPKHLVRDDLYNFDWICRDEYSHTRKLASEVFEEIGVECSSFNVMGIVASPTAIKETVTHSDKNSNRPIVSIISRHVIATELDNGQLFEARIKDFDIKRKFYIVYSKERKHDAFVDNVVNYLLKIEM